MKCTNLKPQPVLGHSSPLLRNMPTSLSTTQSTTVALGDAKWQRGQTLASARKTAEKHMASTDDTCCPTWGDASQGAVSWGPLGACPLENGIPLKESQSAG